LLFTNQPLLVGVCLYLFIINFQHHNIFKLKRNYYQPFSIFLAVKAANTELLYNQLVIEA